MRVDLVDLGERLVDEDDGDENGEAFLREARDVTHEGAEVEGDDDEQRDHHPEPDPEPQRHEVYVVFPVGKTGRFFRILKDMKRHTTVQHDTLSCCTDVIHYCAMKLSYNIIAHHHPKLDPEAHRDEIYVVFPVGKTGGVFQH